MGLFKKLFTGGIGTVIEKVGGVVDEFHLSKEEKARLQLELKSMLLKRENEIDETLRTEMQAQKDTLVAELTQGDVYTKRARPTVVYAGLAIIIINNIILPTIFHLTGNNIDPFKIPTEFWVGWSGIVATWSIGRTMEKRGAGNKFSRALTGNKKIESVLEEDIVG